MPGQAGAERVSAPVDWPDRAAVVATVAQAGGAERGRNGKGRNHEGMNQGHLLRQGYFRALGYVLVWTSPYSVTVLDVRPVLALGGCRPQR